MGACRLGAVPRPVRRRRVVNRLAEHGAAVGLAPHLHLLHEAKDLRDIELDQVRGQRWRAERKFTITALACPARGAENQGRPATCALKTWIDRELVRAGDVCLSIPMVVGTALWLVQCDGADEATITDCHEAVTEPNAARGHLGTLIDACS